MNLDSQSIPARVKIVNGIFIGGRNPGIRLKTVLEWVMSCEVANFPDRNITNISCNIPADLFGMLLPLVFFLATAGETFRSQLGKTRLKSKLLDFTMLSHASLGAIRS